MEATARLLVHSLSVQLMLIACTLPASEAQAEQEDTHPRGLAASNGTVMLVSTGGGAGASCRRRGQASKGQAKLQRGGDT